MPITPRDVGIIGEEVASEYLLRNGYKIVERNYFRKVGEIDIVAFKGSSIHFIEVKTVSYETKSELETSVRRGTWRPEEKVDDFKARQIKKAIEIWLSENSYTEHFSVDVIGVRIVPRETFATVSHLEGVIL